MAANLASLQLSSIDYGVSYSTTNQTKATIAVTRTGNKAEAVTVDYAVNDLTAVAGKDYSQAVGTLSFGANEEEKTFDVSILRNTPSEVKKVAVVELKNPEPSGKAILGNPPKATLTISPPGVVGTQPASSGRRGELWLQYGIFGLLGGIFVYFLIRGVLGDNSILGDLADIEKARGLITFLIAVCTVAIAAHLEHISDTEPRHKSAAAVYSGQRDSNASHRRSWNDSGLLLWHLSKRNSAAPTSFRNPDLQ